MEFEAENKRKYKKITISLDQDTLAYLKAEREQKGIPISNHIAKAIKEREQTKYYLQTLQTKVQQQEKAINSYTELIELKEQERIKQLKELERQKKEKEQELEAKEKELEKYNKQQQRGYFENVIRAIFNIKE